MLLKSNKFLYYLILINWVFLLLSINANPYNIDKYENITFLINNIRIIIPLLISCILFIIFLFLLKTNLKTFIQKKNIIYFLFILYFLIQLFGLTTTPDRFFSIENTYLAIFGINSLIILIIIENFFSRENSIKLKKIIFIMSIFLITSAAIIIFYFVCSKIGFAGFLILYNFIDPNDTFLGQILPRVTGFARMLAIIGIFIFIYAITNNLLKNKIILLTQFFLALLIVFIQSRGAILCYFFIVILIILFEIKNNFQKIFLFIIIILLPFVIQVTLMSNNKINNILQESLVNNLEIRLNSNMIKSGNLSKNLDSTKNQEVINNKMKESNIDKIRLYKNLSTSGRTFLWKSIIERYDKNKLFGYGPQADRFLLGNGLEKLYGFGNNVSNAILYAFACSGYFGFFLMILIYIMIIYLIYDNFFIKKIFLNNDNFFKKIAFYFVIFFIIRSIFENSFAYFGIDFLIIVTSIGILINDNYVKLFLKSK